MKIGKLQNDNLKNDSITKMTLFNEENMLVFHIVLKSGEDFPPCEHEKCSLLIYVIDGTGQIINKDESTSITVGTVIYFDETDLFKIQNTSAELLSCLAVISPRPAIKAQYNELGV